MTKIFPTGEFLNIAIPEISRIDTQKMGGFEKVNSFGDFEYPLAQSPGCKWMYISIKWWDFCGDIGLEGFEKSTNPKVKMFKLRKLLADPANGKIYFLVGGKCGPCPCIAS